MTDENYETFVFCFANEAARSALCGELFKRFSFAGGGDTKLTAVSCGDAMSVSDAMRMALECRDLDPSERSELALEMAESGTWLGCLATAAKWELRVQDGDLVDDRVSDTHPKDGDVKQAPLGSGAGLQGNAQGNPDE